jgi:hypothetical protein
MAKNIFWHDGTLEAIRLIAPSRRRLGSVEIDLSLYPTDRSAQRSTYTLVCSRVTSFEMIGDMLELQDNAGAGNIEDGALSSVEGKAGAELRLVGGHLRVVAARIGLRKRSA